MPCARGFHAPHVSSEQGDINPLLASRMMRLVERAVARTADAVFDGEHADDLERFAYRAAMSASTPQNLMPAPLTAGGTYRLPSYNGGGEPVDFPVLQSDGMDDAVQPGASAENIFEFEAENIFVGAALEEEQRTSADDLIVHRRFPRLAVLRAVGNNYFYTGGTPFVTAGNVARAFAWGRILFGRTGYAVLEGAAGQRQRQILRCAAF